jgi:4-amino-4-deoxy-L-arabinose transferase-like glycosyltransferase
MPEYDDRNRGLRDRFRLTPPALAPALVLVGLSGAVALVHWDEIDAALYVVVARNLAADGTPFLLRYVPPLDPFYEHPPGWLWILAAALRVFPAFPLGVLSVAAGLGTLVIARRLGAAWVGDRAALFATLLLAANAKFILQHGLARLDAPLLLFFTASVAALASSRGRPSRLFIGGLLAGIGVLVKGPPALGAPLVAALAAVALGRRSELASARTWGWTLAGLSIPTGAFFLYDHLVLGSAWLHGYVDSQVLASLDGRRIQGGQGVLYLFSRVLWDRFTPGVILGAVALVPAVVPRLRKWTSPEQLRPRLALLLWVLVPLLGFGMASRAYWVYLLPAYVPLALLAGAAVDDIARAALGVSGAERVARATARVGVAAGAVLVVAAVLGAGRLVAPPCMMEGLAERAGAVARGRGLVMLVSRPDDWMALSVTADHARAAVLLTPDLTAAAARPDAATILAPASAASPPGWRVDSRTRRWSLLVRAGEAEHVQASVSRPAP